MTKVPSGIYLLIVIVFGILGIAVSEMFHFSDFALQLHKHYAIKNNNKISVDIAASPISSFHDNDLPAYLRLGSDI